jgi:very-short-patch-repair endonuclease
VLASICSLWYTLGREEPSFFRAVFSYRRGRGASRGCSQPTPFPRYFYLVGQKGLGMSYQDAVRDGIRIAEEYKRIVYFPHCVYCGKEVKTWFYFSEYGYSCVECEALKRLKVRQERAEKRARERAEKGIVPVPTAKQKEKAEKAKTKNESMIVRAIKRINGMTDIGQYEQAIKKVQTEMESGMVFQSSDEVMVALELSRKNISYRTQVKFGPYRADFVLDDDKVVLEVDGKLYHTEDREFNSNLRDALILAALGPKWELVRITDDNINRQITQLTKAIARAIEYKKKDRARSTEFIRRSNLNL